MAELRAFACGNTTQDISRMLKGAPRERRDFPATAFLTSDGEHTVLFDTGYAPKPWRTGAKGWLYRRLVPPRIEPAEAIAAQLDVSAVTHVVLSHLHPDHIGGVQFFPHAAFVLSAGAVDTLREPRLTEGLLSGLLPPWFDTADRIVVSDYADGPFGLRTHDLFGDGSYLIVDLPGHARGHIGALVNNRILLAGDAAWGRALLGEESRIRALPRAIGHDHAAQTRTAGALLAAEAAGVVLRFSHDPFVAGAIPL